jgi:predicted dehydrogenase
MSAVTLSPKRAEEPDTIVITTRKIRTGTEREGTPKIRIGLIGCGGIAHSHLGHLQGIREAKVVAVADPNEQSIERLRGAFPSASEIGTFFDYQQMLDSADLDAVEILTPHALHFEQIMESLSKGLHVLVEKPMVCTVEHAKKVVAKSEQSSRMVLVSYQRHYQPQFRYIKEVIDSGGLGRIQFVSALQCQEWLEGTKNTWRQDPVLSGGGQLNDSGSHLLDIILWTTGLRATEVFAYVDKLSSQVDINSALSVKLSNGAEANISIVGNSPTWWEDITFWGEKGAIFYRNGRLQHLAAGGQGFLEPTRLPPGSNPDRNFVRAILGMENVDSPPICGLNVAELTEAAWRSAETGSRIVMGSP